MPELREFDCRYYKEDKFIMGSHYRYRTSSGRLIDIPKGFITDLASVPKMFRNVFNTYGKNYTRAAVVHDYLYAHGHQMGIDRKQADEIFLEIMKERGVNFFKRNLMYWSVRVAGRRHYKKGR